MKKIFNLSAYLRLASVLLALITVILCLFATGISAYDENVEPDGDEYISVEWEYVDEDTIKRGDKIYKYRNDDYKEPLRIDPIEHFYVFDNTIYSSYYGENVRVESYDYDCEIIWIRPRGYGSARTYVTEKGAEMINEMYKLSDVLYYLTPNDNMYSSLDEQLSWKLIATHNSKENKIWVSSYKLENCEQYDLYAFEKESRAVSICLGTVYFFEDEVYYLHTYGMEYTYIGNDGKLHYYDDNVKVAKLDIALAEQINAAIENAEDLSPEYIYEHEDMTEDDVSVDGFLSAYGVLSFWACFIIVGLILPVPFFIIGLVFPRVKGMGRPKYWYIVSAIAAVWIIVAILTMVILLLAI